MTKDDAIKAMQAGEKVTHNHFTPDEWMRINNVGRYEFEDNATCTASSFWEFRPDDSWQCGWKVFRELGYVDDSFKEIPAKNSVLHKQAM